jgi:23S rRNA pseudouridine2457 synthase
VRGREAGPSGLSTWLEIVLTEGKNRQVRRMSAAVGHEVEALVRVGIGALALDDLGLAPGEWRELRADEVARLTRPRPLGSGQPRGVWGDGIPPSKRR